MPSGEPPALTYWELYYDLSMKDVITLNIFHIGGGGIDIGPAEALFKLPNIRIQLYLFELRSSEESSLAVSKIDSKLGIDVFRVQIGISDTKKSALFNINKFPLSSSLFDSSPLTYNDCPNFSSNVEGISSPIKSWGQNTTLDEQIEVSLIDLDFLIQTEVVPKPDFLSMDIQGGELDALNGAKNALKESILGIATEVEFFEIYRDQPLYQDQARILDQFSFRLLDIPGFQKWFPGPAVGKGFATVAEPIFVKFVQDHRGKIYGNRVPTDISTISTERLFKLALISWAFQRYSYFYTLIDYIRVNRRSEFDLLETSNSFEKYFNIYQKINRALAKTDKNPWFFLENPHELTGGIKIRIFLYLRKIMKILRLENVVQKIEVESRLSDNLNF